MRDLDYSAAVDFLARLFEGTEHAVEIRALPQEHGAGRAAPLFGRDPALAVDHCVRWDGPERAVYFGCCTRLTGAPAGTRADLAELAALWVDIDVYKLNLDNNNLGKSLGAAADERPAGLVLALGNVSDSPRTKTEIIVALRTLPFPPSVFVDSGGGLHCYWLLKEPIDVRQGIDGWETTEHDIVAVLKQLAGVCAGDIGVCDLARVLRLPGTHNTKDGGLRRVEVLPAVSSWARYEFSDLVDMLDTQRPVVERPAPTAEAGAGPVETNPFLDAAKRFAFKTPIDVEQRLAQITYLADGPAGINATQRDVSASMVRRGHEDDVIVEMLMAATQRAAWPHGEKWNWKREETKIRRLITDWRKKLAKEAPTPDPRPSAPVIQLRGGSAQEAQETEEKRDPAPELSGFPLNDLGNANRLIIHHGTALRYVVGIGWHVWDGRRYKADPGTIDSRKLAHETARTMLMQAFDLRTGTEKAAKAREAIIKFAISSGNSNRIVGMLSQAEPHLVAASDDLDKDPMLLNCLNGTVDLRTGDVRPHAQTDLLTKLCGANYDQAAECPIWEKFLSEIFDGDVDLVAFVQRAIGYSLTGLTSEQVVFILHGSGSNGKSVLVETIAAVLAEYVNRSPAETWISKPNNGPSNDIAALAGARFVSVVETEHDKQLAEALVKQATGGDAMTARFHYKEFFSFIPKFKLWLATNHKPRIRGSDYAIWRRILLLPFTVTFVDKDKLVEGQKVKDLDLKNKLSDEFPGILAWMIRGCKAWQETGLQSPAAVVHATESYQDSQDSVSGFIRDNCHLSRGLSCSIGLLHVSYEIWCEENDEAPMTKQALGKNLDERGYPSGPRTDRARLRKGVDLKEEFKASAAFRQANSNNKSDA